MLRRIAIVWGLALALMAQVLAPASAQNTTGLTLTTCGSPVVAFKAGNPGPFTVDVNGNLCVTGTFAFSPSGTQDVNLKQVGGVATSVGNGVAGTAVQRVTVASDNTPFPVKIDQTTPGTTNAVSASNFPATVDTNSGNAGASTPRSAIATNNPAIANWGQGATGAAAPSGASQAAGAAQNAEATAVTNGQLKALVTDLVGKLIVLPYANPENFVSGVTAAMTGTTSTSLIASPGGSLRNYLTQITCTNSHATVGTFVVIQDGSGGTTIYEGYAAAVGGGFSISFPAPLRQPTVATALFVADVTTGANVICAGSGYKGL